MFTRSWLGGLLRHQPLRIYGCAAVVAIAVALFASLGSFLTAAKADMTRHAANGVGVDWQVEAARGTDPQSVVDAVARDPHTSAARTVWFAATTGFTAATENTSQTTGAGVVLGIPADYTQVFPDSVRFLVGSHDGVLLAQQTAANLHATVGALISIGRAGLAPVRMRVDGVVDLPQADSLFQKVGAPPGAQPQAPPDNVVLVPDTVWHATFDLLTRTRADLAHAQVHVRVRRDLPHDPAVAFSHVTAAAHHLEVVLAGGGVVGDNLAAALDGARSDAVYAQVMFVLIGLPGGALAGLLAYVVVRAGRARRRRELSLLRARGASIPMLERIVLAEAAIVAVIAGAFGLAGALVIGRVEFASATFGTTPLGAAVWAAVAVATGGVISAATLAIPARRDARALTVSRGRLEIDESESAARGRWIVGLLLLGAALLLLWATGRRGYRLVLAPEGVPTISVDYGALLAPILLWIALGVIAWLGVELGLRRGTRAIRAALRPLAGSLARPVASALRAHRRALASAVVLVSLTIAFAVSTSVFDSTYRRQVEVDAFLTNGADVTVTLLAPRASDPSPQPALARVPGVEHIEAVQHRFVYVGTDLQDLYAVDPRTVIAGGRLQDAYFAGGSAHALMSTLASQPDRVLVSAETVRDFQLALGDELHLRVRDGTTGALEPVTFHYAGVIKEFPTAPRDSFIVANREYVAAQTHDDVRNVLLVATKQAPRTVAAKIRAVVGNTAQVTDIDTSRRVVGSSLTAVDLRGLTRVELGFAFALAALGGGAVLGLGLRERRRSFAILALLGARPRQLGAFIRTEALIVTAAGFVIGIGCGVGLSAVLVKVLTGVFDPPPAALAVPWGYLTILFVCTIAALAGATELTLRRAGQPQIEQLHDL